MTVRTFFAATSAVLAAAAVFSLLISTIYAENPQLNTNQMQFQWQIISAKNFSTQIHLHPHILLLVTVPWCGESRSLMRKISLKLADEQQKYSSLQLMLVYRNVDKVLADSLGAVEDITVLCYHHAVSYKYKGSLRVPDILSSVHYMASLVPEDLPLRKISNSEDMKLFLTSTDKAVLLLETCGWASKLLAQLTVNQTVQEGLALQVLRDLNKEINKTQASGWNKYSKHDVGNKMMICEVEDGYGGPWAGKFCAENGTSFPRNADMPTTFGTSCNFNEYKKFESFFSKFIAAARDAFLPSQRQRYALISDTLLLSPLSIEVSDPWSLIISYSGCPSCVMKINEETYLQDTLEMHDLPVIELLEDENDLGPSLPIGKPSIVLFVDRRSDSKETAKKSQEALLSLKEFVQQHRKFHQTGGQSNERPGKPHSEKGSVATYGSSRLVLSSASDKMKDKMSVVIIKDGKYVTLDDANLDIQSSSLHEILTKLLGQKKHSKLSSLAKEAGFQLLSDDIDIKITNVLSPEIGTQKLDSFGRLDEVADTNVINPPPEAGLEHLQHAHVELPFDDTEQKSPEDLPSLQTGLDDIHQSFKDLEVVSSAVMDSEIQASVEADKSESLEHHYNSFTGSFFFSDGNNKFLRSLINDLEVPSIVIIDPVSQQHYVFSGETTFNLSSISTIIDRFLNGTLIPYQRSGPLRKAIEMPHPPFVNLDFHEKDPIPSVTTDTFSELVIGNGHSDAHNLTNAWNKDVLVLFSSTSCGFCQRMELVVREVYRALKGYMNLVKCDSKSKELCSEGNFKDVISKLPAIFSIDCTLNDCGWILKSAGHREVYPSLLLFPANKKTVIPFNGNMIVADVMAFVANHGVSSEHLVRQKGTLWTGGGENDNHDISTDTFSISFSPENNKHVITDIIKLQNQVSDEKEASQNLVVGSLLVASERLNGINPFSEAKILIVSASPDSGFQGLIVNKPISWDHIIGSENVDFLREAPLSYGGPVIQEGRPLVSLTRNLPLNHQYPQTQTLPDVYFLDPSETINVIEEIQAVNKSASDYWFFWGYSGWHWDQLYNEVTQGAWKVHDGNVDHLQWP
ncbi:hypothetical protein RND81_08G169400 [Saponaria officinalis]|uniref:Thioredoxin domain-containing protein n=1 Tax=Saponaria officinalis TaxID=3572 RepID=A0AAW1J907_SAPOF